MISEWTATALETTPGLLFFGQLTEIRLLTRNSEVRIEASKRGICIAGR